MAQIKITQFGGEMPSASARRIVAPNARTAQNIMARSNEFRPLAVDGASVATTLTSNPKSLYKFTMASGGGVNAANAGWVSTPDPACYVKGQINDANTERVYASTMTSGATPPVVSDFQFTGLIPSSGTVKLLGVPPLTTKPTTTHIVSNEYTFDEDTAARTAIPIQMKAGAVASATYVAYGNAPTIITSGQDAGWLAHGTAVSAGTLPTTNLGDYAFLVKMTASASGGYVLPAVHNWLAGTEFAGKQITWSGNVYWAVPITLQGTGYSVNLSTLADHFRGIANPDPQFDRADTTGYSGSTHPIGNPTPANKQFATDASATANAQNVVNMYLPTAEPQKTSIEALNKAQQALIDAVTNFTNVTVQASSVKDFYADVAVSAEITQAIALFASQLAAPLEGALAVLYSQDGGTAGPAEAAGFTPASIIALLPTVFTVAGVGSNAYMYFTDDGALSLRLAAFKAAVATLFTTRINADTAILANKSWVANRMNEELNNYGDAFALAISPYRWQVTDTVDYTKGTGTAVTEPAQAASNRPTAVVKAIADLAIAAKRVTNDYIEITGKLITLIDEIFDAKGGFAESMPTPVEQIFDTRFYLITLVTAWGEESAPSPVSDILTVDQNDTVVIADPTGYETDREIIGWRLYRSNTGSTETAFQLVDVPLAAGYDAANKCMSFGYDLTDTLLDAELASTLATTTWLPPPTNLRGLCGMSNGVMAGYFENMLCFCEPYVPYAWPVQYQQPTSGQIVGLGSFGQSVFVATQRTNYIASGSDSASMSMIELPSSQICVSARSIVSVETGVIFASPDGLCLADHSGIKVITEGLYTREDWLAIKPETIFAALHDGSYHFVYNTAGTGGDPSTSVCYALDFTAAKLIKLDLQCSAFHADKAGDILYSVNGTSITAMFGGGTKRTGVYRTGIINTGLQQPLAWLQVDSDFAANVTIKWYGDGTLRHTATVTSIAPVRLPPGRYLEHEIEISTTARVTSVMLAGSTQELQA